jgi:threonine dehydratase
MTPELSLASKPHRGPIQVSEAEIAEAIRLYFSATHTLTEGATAVPLAALI